MPAEAASVESWSDNATGTDSADFFRSELETSVPICMVKQLRRLDLAIAVVFYVELRRKLAQIIVRPRVIEVEGFV